MYNFMKLYLNLPKLIVNVLIYYISKVQIKNVC